MTRESLTRALAVITAGFALLIIVAGAAVTPGYSHIGNYISELGATGAPFGEVISLGGFLPIGILIAMFLVAALPITRVENSGRVGLLLFLGSQSLAYISAALAPCDFGCPPEGSVTQNLHNAFGLVTYLLAAIGLFLLARTRALTAVARTGFLVAGLLWLAVFFLMLAPALQPWGGLLQRVAEAILWLAVLFIAFRMTNQASRAALPNL